MNAPPFQASALWSLRVRTLFLVALAVVPSLVLIDVSAQQQKAMTRKQAVANLLGLVHIAREDAEGRVESARELLTTLAEIPYIQERDPVRSNALFKRLLASYPTYANVGAASLDGRVFASGVPLKQPVNVADRPYFRNAVQTGRFASGTYQVGRITGKPSINFGYPLRNAKGAIVGVLFAALDVQAISRTNRWDLPEGAALSMVDREGRILVRYPDVEAWQGQMLPENTVYRKMLASDGGSIEGVGLDGVDRLFVYTKLQLLDVEVPVHTIISIPSANVYGAIDRAYRQHLASMLAVAALAMLAAWLGGDWFFLRQVKALMRAARSIRDGDLSARTGLQGGHDELSQLIASFDDMASSLERLTARHDIILESAGEGIMGVDLNGVTTFANSAATRMLGYEPGELIGVPHHPTIHSRRADGSEYPADQCPVHLTCQDGRSHRGDDEALWRKDGTSFPVDYIVSPAREGGKLVGAVITFKDITERKQAEAETRKAHEEVLQAALAKKQFYRDALKSVTQGKLHLVDEEDIEVEGECVLETALLTPEDDRGARRLILEAAEKAGMSPARAKELVMAAGEASTNAVKHAVDGRAQVFVAEDRVIVRISDRGTGIREEDLPATLLEPGFSTKVSLGMGYTLMLQLADRVWLSTGPEGTIVQIEKWIRPAERPLTPVESALGRF
jgi:PAS domain S-box-containing protein